jgi:hypothetical protein
MKRYVVVCTSKIHIEEEDFKLSVEFMCSLARIEKVAESEIEGVAEYKVAKVLGHTHRGNKLLSKGDTIPEFKESKLEFATDKAAILWFKLSKGGR